MSSDPIRQASARAVEERRRLGLGSEPIVDMRDLVEQQGVLVYATPIPGGSLSGCFALIAGDCWIMVNAANTLGRQRFTIAHEYCHSLVDRKLEFVVCTADKPPHERYADAFAAVFLMPAESAEQFFAADVVAGKGVRGERVIEYCYAFGVSYAAAVYRLHNLRRLTAAQRDVLLNTQPTRLAASMGYDIKDPTSPFFTPDSVSGQSVGSLPRRYRSAAVRAFEENRISESKLAELLGIDVDDLDDVLNPEEPEEVPFV